MRVSVPFAYEATVYTARGDDVDRRYRETLDVEIPSVTSDDAPVFLTWDGARPLEAGYGEGYVPLEARSYGGGFYEPIRQKVYENADGWKVVSLSGDDAREVVAADGAHRNLSLRDFFDLDAVLLSQEVKLKGPPRKETVKWSKRDEAISKVADLGSKLLEVDGVLHRRISEPVLLAAPDFPMVRLVCLDGMRHEDRANLFRMDRLDEAVAYSLEVAPFHDKVPNVARFTLHDPSVLRADLGRDALMASAYYLERHAANVIATLRREGVEAFCDLQDARKEGSARVAPDPAEVRDKALRLVDELLVADPRDKEARLCRLRLETTAAVAASPVMEDVDAEALRF